jgi:glutathione S-transferase
MVEESGVPFKLHQIDIHKGVQNTDAYEKLNPYQKIPALVDPEGPEGKPATAIFFPSATPEIRTARTLQRKRRQIDCDSNRISYGVNRIGFRGRPWPSS